MSYLDNFFTIHSPGIVYSDSDGKVLGLAYCRRRETEIRATEPQIQYQFDHQDR